MEAIRDGGRQTRKSASPEIPPCRGRVVTKPGHMYQTHTSPIGGYGQVVRKLLLHKQFVPGNAQKKRAALRKVVMPKPSRWQVSFRGAGYGKKGCSSYSGICVQQGFDLGRNGPKGPKRRADADYQMEAVKADKERWRVLEELDQDKYAKHRKEWLKMNKERRSASLPIKPFKSPCYRTADKNYDHTGHAI